MASTHGFQGTGACVSPIGLVVSHTKAYLVFFPYVKDDSPCVNAVIAGMFKMDDVHAIVTLITKYILGVRTSSFELMPKEIYSKSIISVKEAQVDNMNFMLKEEQQRVKEQKDLLKEEQQRVKEQKGLIKEQKELIEEQKQLAADDVQRALKRPRL